MRLRWTERARRDFNLAFAFLHEESPRSARGFAGRIRKAVRRIRDLPESGAPALDLKPERTFRHVVTATHRVIYQITSNEIVILRIWDGRRNPQDLKPGSAMDR